MCHRFAPLTVNELNVALKNQWAMGHAQVPRRPEGETVPDAYPGTQVPLFVTDDTGKLMTQTLTWGFDRSQRDRDNRGITSAAHKDWSTDGRTSTRATGNNRASSDTTRGGEDGGASIDGITATGGRGADRNCGANRSRGVDRNRGATDGIVFNTRIETALDQARSGRGMWAEAIEHGRCLVPARAFWEWWTTADPHATYVDEEGRTRRRQVRYTLAGHTIFLMAGVQANGRFSIVTTTPNTDVSPIHNRMPLVLGPGESRIWLGSGWGSLADRSHIRLARAVDD